MKSNAKCKNSSHPLGDLGVTHRFIYGSMESSTGGQGARATENETLASGGPPFRLATKYALLLPVPVL